MKQILNGWRVSSVLRFVVCLFALAFALPTQAEDGKSAHITARLITESRTVAPNGDVTAALDYTAAPGWHTYWINPGDTGLAPKFTWNLPDNVTAGDIQFPVPETLPTLGLMSYGYEGSTVLLVKLHNASTLAAGETLPLKAHVDFLVCKDVCIPESVDVSTSIKVGTAQSGGGEGVIDKALKAMPPSAPISATVVVKGDSVELGFAAPKTNSALIDALSRPQGAYLFPAQSDLLVPSAPQVLDMGADGFTLRTQAGKNTAPCAPAKPDTRTPSCFGRMTGILKLADGRAFQVAFTLADALPAGVHGLGAAPAGKTDTSAGGIVVAMLFAFLGGLILNLMPCVFPVLSMKLLSLSRAGHDTSAARSEALVYGAGAVVSFVALAGLLEVAHLFGASLGWGFQLQSPYVVAVLALIMLLVALNMSGVFEVGQSLQGVGASAFDQKRPLLSAFLTGVLAVVVAAPCTAPFMATAIGVALAQGGVTSFAIFIALGLGFALPFVALTFLITLVPALASALPKPGKWMTWLKIALSLLMYAAALWLVWVFAQQVQTGGLLLLVLSLAVVVVATLPLRVLPGPARIGLLAAGVVLCLVAAGLPRTSKIDSLPSGLLPHRDFSVETLASLRAGNTPVLVDLTAAWCVTCKVNERLVLSTAKFEAALKDTGTVYMVGDWTNQDAAISRYLTLYGRSGVPLYVYYGRNNAAPVVLPQMLNTDAVVKLLKDGAK